MKVTFSKSQWEGIGKKAGWMKEAAGVTPAAPAPAPAPAATATAATPAAGVTPPVGQEGQVPPHPTMQAIADTITKVSSGIGPGGELAKEAQALLSSGASHTTSALVGQIKQVLSVLEQYLQ